MTSEAYPLRTDVTGELASFVAQLDYGKLPEPTRGNLVLFFLDYVASIHAGYRTNGRANGAVREVVLGGAPRGRSHVLFRDEPVSPLNAAFLNAFYVHGADMDDGNKLAAGHMGAPVVSAVAALAEDRRSSFGEFYSAMAAGYEVFCRLSAASMPHLVDRGFHSTGTAGALAAAAACSRLLGLDPDGVANALSLSATQACGLLLAGETRQEMKPLNPANAARTGVFSALLAEKGVQGPLAPLESDKGWLHAMTPNPDLGVLTGGLGERFFVDESYLKPYPSCRHTHCAIEAAIAVGEQVLPEEVELAEVVTYGHAIELAGKLGFPATAGEAKFSIKYAVATALAKGRFSLDDLSPESAGDEVRRLVGTVGIVRDDSYERPSEGVRGACLVAKTKDGRTVRREVLVPKGDPENPLTADDVERKLKDCYCDAGGASDAQEAAAFLEWYRPIASDPSNAFVFPRKEG